MTDAGAPSTLRSDARRNVDRIRVAAAEVFADRGLSAPLEDVAAAAKVSKATIFNRFGGRAGLVDAVIDDVAAKELLEIIGHARTISDARGRVRAYVGALRDLQYRSPAVNGVLLRQVPGSEALMDLCREGEAFHAELVAQGRAAGVLADEVTAGDLHALTVDGALALEHGGRPPRADYDRRTGFILDGICRPG
ncbi:TetR family transcriptional regulator [Nocardioides albertanoniae]|uniref:TetR family transcriptional regulator n=1 Tax=Nocardioides albertanoniae TaxID=1175486 RepID=A0A543AB38_9ACTN|nr:TetR family transcriptional regulator [Nocardioides albertanoniae]TQL69785.1 TetR family transcriptional regulator [Nocardioides albertanoniae]